MSSAGVSLATQEEVSESASSKTKTEPTTTGDAAGLHARLEVALERQRAAWKALKEVEDGLSNEREELEAKYTAARRELEAKHVAARAEHKRAWKPKLAEACNDVAKTTGEVVRVRDQYHKRGEVEFDSLLVVGNDGIAAILPFLTLLELGRCEITCRTFKVLSQDSAHWEYIEKCLPVIKRSSASNARTRVVRHHAASKLAERVEPLVKDHCFGCMACSEFPSKLLIDPSPADFELFVRFSKDTPSGRILVLEGFVDHRLYNVPKPFSTQYPTSLTFNLDAFDLSSWQSMENLFCLNRGKNNAGWRKCVQNALLELTATIIAVERSTSEAHLVVGSSEFDYEDDDINGKPTFYSSEDMTVCPHEYDGDRTMSCLALAFKWDDDRDTDRKFECHVIQT